MYQTLKLRELNPFITCGICGGYLIDATTITECLHTFCRSCIVKHLQEDNICPTCKIVVHHSYPMNYISSDRTMQEIVYKLVPGLQERELQRQKEFEVAMFMYRTGEQQNAYNAMNSRKTLVDNLSPSSPCSSNEKEHQDYHRGDEQVAICMECYRANGKYSLKPLPRKYLRLSSQATVLHLKKFLAKKLCLDDHKDVDILCNDEILGKDHTLKFICVTRWRFKELTRYATSLAERKLQQLKKARACQQVMKNAYEEVIWSLDNLIKNLTKDDPHTMVCDKHRKPNRGGEFSWARTKLKLGKESVT